MTARLADRTEARAARQGCRGCGFKRLALGFYFALIAVVVAREAWLAPSAHAPLFWLALKSAPLVLFLPALLRGRPKPWIYASLLVLLYLTEGAVLAFGARDGAVVARIEALLAVAFFVSAALYARATEGVR
jgi:uncharacterized membrane protein